MRGNRIAYTVRRLEDQAGYVIDARGIGCNVRQLVGVYVNKHAADEAVRHFALGPPPDLPPPAAPKG